MVSKMLVVLRFAEVLEGLERCGRLVGYEFPANVVGIQLDGTEL